MNTKGAVAAGHPLTAQSAHEILQAGGNAYDAVIAAAFSACVCEPLLASAGGGGYLLAAPSSSPAILFDFFVQTPRRKIPDCEFFEIHADFGPIKQGFHVGLGTAATPGFIKGMFHAHRRLGKMPMAELITMAMELAKTGVTVSDFQAYLFEVIKPIPWLDPIGQRLYSDDNGNPLAENRIQKQPQLADFLQALRHEDERMFYQGEIARSVAALCEQGRGLLRYEDFAGYEVIENPPLSLAYRGHAIETNSLPSSGGLLIGLALKYLENQTQTPAQLGEKEAASYFVETLKILLDVRQRQQLSEELLEQPFLQTLPPVSRGTTHISVVDGEYNLASMSLSNGEGCGRFIPDTGIMLNNMLGEEDLHPNGFHQWPLDTRMTSMMAPTLIKKRPHTLLALGSGGSNRLRTAILQVIINLVDWDLDVEDAVNRPRLHFEDDILQVEGGHDEALIRYLQQQYRTHRWQGLNLYFGGTHMAGIQRQRWVAVGDPRRSGHGIISGIP